MYTSISQLMKKKHTPSECYHFRVSESNAQSNTQNVQFAMCIRNTSMNCNIKSEFRQRISEIMRFDLLLMLENVSRRVPDISCVFHWLAKRFMCSNSVVKHTHTQAHMFTSRSQIRTYMQTVNCEWKKHRFLKDVNRKSSNIYRHTHTLKHMIFECKLFMVVSRHTIDLRMMMERSYSSPSSMAIYSI